MPRLWMLRLLPVRRALAPTVAALALLAACAGPDGPEARAAEPTWPPVWADSPVAVTESGPPAFDAPSATHCRRPPITHEVPGQAAGRPDAAWERDARRRVRPERAEAEAMRARPLSAAPAPSAARKASAGAALADIAPAPPTASPSFAPRLPRPQAPAHAPVTAGMVDDNADFGAYLAYLHRGSRLPVPRHEVRERYLLEVTDAAGRPVHDAEVAVQRAGVAEPVMWARTDTFGRVWLHPRVFLGAQNADDPRLGVAVRRGEQTAHAVLERGQRHSVQLRLGARPAATRPQLDLVFLVDATGSMGDEIAKLKHAMQAMAQQIAQLPGQPDICWGLVAYRDHGDAFVTRRHDFTNDLGAFQQVLAQVQAAGGGDTPEALNEALHETVHRLSWRQDAARLVVLVADAPPHLDGRACRRADDAAQQQRPTSPCPRYDRDMQAALAKGIKLLAVGASGLDPQGEYVFRQMAQYTAGRFVFLTYRDAADPGSGPGSQTVHDVPQYSVQTLDQLVVRLVREELAPLSRS